MSISDEQAYINSTFPAEDTDTSKGLERYRKTMPEEILRLWAEDAQRKLDLTGSALRTLLEAVTPSYKLSPEGRDFLEEATKDLNS